MAWKTSYYHFDAVGSTRVLTDADQNVRTSYSQTAFGKQLTSDSAVVNPFRFIGQLGYYLDSATGLFNVKERVYDSVTGRWLSQDPARSEQNLFRYVSNNPLNGIDPTGLYKIINDANRPQQVKTARDELDAAVKAGVITKAEKELRLKIVDAALSGKVASGGTQDQRDPTHWEEDPATGKWRFKQGGSPSKGLEHGFTRSGNDRYGTKCRQASELNKLRGQAQYAESIGRRGKFDAFVAGKVPGTLFPDPDRTEKDGIIKSELEDVETNNAGIDRKKLLPGDQTWVKNPKFQTIVGDEGSNKIYIGGGLWVPPYGADGTVTGLNYNEYLDAVTGYEGSPEIGSLKINRLHRPRVPSFLK